MDETTIKSISELFKTLGDPTRLRILFTLLQRGEQNVGEIAGQVDMSESAVSHQLRVLRLQRLVHAHKSGRTVTYCLDDDHVKSLLRQAFDHYQEHRALPRGYPHRT